MGRSQRLGFVTRMVASVECLLSLSAGVCRGQSGGVQAEGPKFRLVRSVSGSKGTPQGGRFTMEDPRSVFLHPV